MHRIRTLVLYLFLICLCLPSVCLADGIRDVTPAEAYQIIQTNSANAPLTILDLRTTPEFLMGHIENAVLINFYDSDFAQRLGNLPRDATYLIYCHSGSRSTRVLSMMRQLGFTHVYHLATGIIGWYKADLPLVR